MFFFLLFFLNQSSVTLGPQSQNDITTCMGAVLKVELQVNYIYHLYLFKDVRFCTASHVIYTMPYRNIALLLSGSSEILFISLLNE